MYPNDMKMIVVANIKKKRDDYEYPSLLHFTDELWLMGRKTFLANLKHQYRVSNKENKIIVPITKRMRLLWVYKFVSFHEWALIIRKMVDRKVFLANPKHQYRVSQYGEHDCRATNKMNGDYYGHPSLTHLMDKLWL